GWRSPDAGVVKITTDGALNLVEGRGGAGGVARSSTAFLGAWSKPYLGVSTDPLIIEAFSLREGVRFATLRGFLHVIIEVDCLELVTLWRTRHNSRSIVAPILNVTETWLAETPSFLVTSLLADCPGNALI
uniref:RNase H type-1 domain-containing protein n=2 Tax=Aegilops tauschii subsp. strangulata TaxID=200361 RepID=A0A453C674_AEGTS